MDRIPIEIDVDDWDQNGSSSNGNVSKDVLECGVTANGQTAKLAYDLDQEQPTCGEQETINVQNYGLGSCQSSGSISVSVVEPNNRTRCRPEIKPMLQIFIKNMLDRGNSKEIEVERDITVLQLKERIYKELFNVVVCQQVLTCNGQTLEDRRTIQSYCVKKGETIHITGRLRGG